MDKDVQMISLLLDTVQDLFKILRDLSGQTDLKKVVGEIHDAVKPYSQKLAEPGIITESNELTEMKEIRTHINEAEDIPDLMKGANDMLVFVQAKNDFHNAEEIEMPDIAEFVNPDNDTEGSIVGSDTSDASNTPGGADNSSVGNKSSSDVADVEEENNDDPDDPPGGGGGSSSSDT